MQRIATLLLLIGVSLPLAAQDLPRVRPGGVATMVVPIEREADSVAYTVRPADGVRLFMPASGRAVAPLGEPIRIPVTVGVPARAGAGRFAVGALELSWPDGRREARELAVEVLPVRGVGFWVAQEGVTADRGSAAELGYRVRNEGNVTDTFHVALKAPSGWSQSAGEVALVLGPGEQEAGLLRAAVPASAAAGEEHVLRLVLSGTEVREPRSVRVTVVTPESPFGDLTTVPATIFVGSTTDGSAMPGLAFSAAGEVRPDLRLTVDLRHADELSPPQVFGGALSGPRLRLGLAGRSWAVRGGDVFSHPDLLTGPGNHGRGLEATASRGGWEGEVFLAQPWSYGTGTEAGHILTAAADRATALGTLGVRAGSVHRDDALLGAYRQTGAVVTYSLRRGAHEVDAEAGYMRVGTDSASTAGPAAEVRYALEAGPVSMAARLRRVPGTSARTGNYGNESFISGSYDLTETLALTGSAYSTEAPRVDRSSRTTSRGTGIGLRLALPNGIGARLLAARRSSGYVGAEIGETDIRMVTAGGDIPVGPFVLEADAGVGESDGPFGGRGYSNARVGARWDGPGHWGWVGLSHHAVGERSGSTIMDVSGSTRFRSAELQAGLNAPLGGADRLRSTTFWSGITIPVMPRTDLSLGAEYRGYSSTPWQLSIGLRRGFGVPLPVSRKPVLEGVIFDDLDGDGVRQEGEPALPGIGVSLGAVRARSDARGRFRFLDATGGRLRIDPANLPLGVSLPAGTELPARGSVEIAVVRTASLELSVFLDRDDDGARDAAETLALGAVASLMDEGGTARHASTDASGRARFSGLRPGRYRLVIHRQGGRVAPPVELDVVLHAGANEQIVVGVPLRTREIRLPGGSSLDRRVNAASGTDSSHGAPLRPAAAPSAAERRIVGEERVEPERSNGRAAVGVGRARGVSPAPRPPSAPTAEGERADGSSAPAAERVGSVAGSDSATSDEAGGGDDDTLWGLLVASVLLTPGLAALGARYAYARRHPPHVDQRGTRV